MEFMPDAKNSKLTAILLLVVVLILVYLLAFHRFIIRHGEYADELSDLRGVELPSRRDGVHELIV